MRLLFVKESLAWPLSNGHDLHCYHMLRALADLGHTLSLATVHRPKPEALAGLTLERQVCLDDETRPGADMSLQLSWLQERFRSYWGVEPARIRAVARIAEDAQADAVVVDGLNVLPYLGGVHGRLRVWYAGDEWAWHHMSQVKFTRMSTWREAKQAIVKGLYERAYRRLLDRVWVVTDPDRRAMSWIGGVRNVDVLPNGLDSDHFAPRDLPEQERSCAFWGRLDFGPNVQALQWFAHNVWPEIHKTVPGAIFTIYGFQPTPPVQAVSRLPGVRLIPDLPDLRDEIARQQVVVLPMVSGGGIKNKLLEAAGMAKAVVCTPRACLGLRDTADLPFVVAKKPAHWIQAVPALWSDQQRRRDLGIRARQWVLGAHPWEAAARTAVAGMEESLGGERQP